MLIDGLTLAENSAVTNMVLPSGPTFPTASAGELFYKTTGTVGVYVYDGSTWVITSGSGGGGAVGGATDAVFYENDISVSADYTITAGKNAMTAGPVTINNGVTVTIPNGSVWSIV